MIVVRVPATSANCCVGFDCMGMAVDWFGTFTFSSSETLTIEGCPPAYQTEDNLVVQAFDRVCQALGRPRPPFALKIDSDIPFARGLGSSATCVVAGLEGANAWFGSPLSKEALLALATEMEGHPDNVAPALFGGVAVSAMQEGEVVSKTLETAPWKALVVVPEQTVSTKEARKVLPAALSFQQAKEQVANALLMEVALREGDERVLQACSVDALHEPYRKRLIPEYERVKRACAARNLPLWISGSGSTMIVLALEESRLDALRNDLSDLACRKVRIARKGADVRYE